MHERMDRAGGLPKSSESRSKKKKTMQIIFQFLFGLIKERWTAAFGKPATLHCFRQECAIIFLKPSFFERQEKLLKEHRYRRILIISLQGGYRVGHSGFAIEKCPVRFQKEPHFYHFCVSCSLRSCLRSWFIRGEVGSFKGGGEQDDSLIEVRKIH